MAAKGHGLVTGRILKSVLAGALMGAAGAPMAGGWGCRCEGCSWGKRCPVET